MKYTDLQIKILQYLYIHPEGATGNVLAEHCGMSLNTIRREFTKIYDLPGEEAFEVVSRPSVGYQLNILDEEKTKLFFRRLNIKVNNPLFDNNDPRSYKTNAIIRRLLTGSYYVNIIGLTELFNYSESSLRRDLKSVEKKLAAYHLTLRQKKGYGFYIEGDEIDKRICLLAQHKLFVNLTEEEKKLEPDFERTFALGDPEIRRCRHILRKQLEQYPNISYKLIDIPNVINYIALIRSRSRYTEQVNVEPWKLDRLRKSGVLMIAQELLETLPWNVEINEREVVAFGSILQAYRTVIGTEQLQMREKQYLETVIDELMSYTDETLKVSDAMTEEDRDELMCILYEIQNRMIFSIQTDKETYRTLHHTNLLAEDLCRAAGSWLEQRMNMPVQNEMELGFYYFYERLFSRKVTSLDSLKLVLVSTYGISYARYCRRILMELYAPYISSIDLLEYSQLHMLENKKYDYVLTDLRHDMLDPAVLKKVCFLENQDEIHRGCKALSDILFERQKEILEGIIHGEIQDADLTELNEHRGHTWKNLPVFTAMDSEKEPGLYYYRTGKGCRVGDKIIKKAAIIYYRPDSFRELKILKQGHLKEIKSRSSK